jgi:hypothetical protein
MIHSNGACCMVGTSRNLDRKIEASSADAAAQLALEYRALFRRGADILEVDRPIDVARMLFGPSGPDAAGRPSLRIE